MAETFAEVARSGFEQRIEVRARLWAGRSPYQQIEVVDTVPFGRALILDDALQTTEADEFCYHEMLVHVPLLAHPNPGRVLIVGGGDGGSMRHVLRHPEVERAVQVELDELVVRVSREWLSSISGGALGWPRAELVIGDGLAYLRDADERFDVILVDSTDPVGPAEGLISEEFFRLASAALAADGMLAIQSGSPLLMRDELRMAAERIARAFPIAATYLGHVPSYPGVLWSYTIGSKQHRPDRPIRRAPEGLRYYTSDLHRAAFALPAYVQSLLAHASDVSPDTPGPILG
jgi:spermidine synthase